MISCSARSCIVTRSNEKPILSILVKYGIKKTITGQNQERQCQRPEPSGVRASAIAGLRRATDSPRIMVGERRS